MPPGVPVATVGVDGAKNAGILAAQMLGISNQAIQDQLTAFKKEQREMVLDSHNALVR
jgi:5-(carboxyamino)imidazole ribonucleotide mutase